MKTRSLEVLSLSSQEAPCLCLEGDDDHGQFDVSLLLQLRQNPCPEEHLTLSDAVQVCVQIQVLYLRWDGESGGFVVNKVFSVMSSSSP